MGEGGRESEGEGDRREADHLEWLEYHGSEKTNLEKEKD